MISQIYLKSLWDHQVQHGSSQRYVAKSVIFWFRAISQDRYSKIWPPSLILTFEMCLYNEKRLNCLIIRLQESDTPRKVSVMLSTLGSFTTRLELLHENTVGESLKRIYICFVFGIELPAWDENVKRPSSTSHSQRNCCLGPTIQELQFVSLPWCSC